MTVKGGDDSVEKLTFPMMSCNAGFFFRYAFVPVERRPAQYEEDPPCAITLFNRGVTIWLAINYQTLKCPY